jgi:hypothetical protein
VGNGAELFRRHPAPRSKLRRIGSSGEPVAVIDDVFADPAGIVAEVANRGSFTAEGIAAEGYPGVQAPAPSAYARALLAAADEALTTLFGTRDGAIGEIVCQFSLVTRPPAALLPLQTVPHVDIAEPDRFAILHFLCAAPFGGTAFYRQNATGLEQVSRTDWPAFAAERDRLLIENPNRAYPNAGTAGYTQTATIEARMDRLVVYRSHSLHSGIVPPDVAHPADPRRGRLTGNLFARYRTG